MTKPPKPNPYDLGLPEAAVRKRRRSRRVARWMLIIAALTALSGWPLFGRSIFSAIHMTDPSQSQFQVILAYILLIISSITLVLGLWYLLLAQVERVARIVESDDAPPDPAKRLCPNCGWFFDPPDRYCRHCGKSLSTSVSAPHKSSDVS